MVGLIWNQKTSGMKMIYNMSLPFQFQFFVYFIIWGSPSIKGDAKFRNFSNCIFFPLNSANFHSWHGLKNPKTVTFVLFSANLETTELPLSKLLKSFSVIWQDFYTIFFPNFQWLKCVARKNHNKKCSHIFWLFYLE